MGCWNSPLGGSLQVMTIKKFHELVWKDYMLPMINEFSPSPFSMTIMAELVEEFLKSSSEESLDVSLADMDMIALKLICAMANDAEDNLKTDLSKATWLQKMCSAKEIRARQAAVTEIRKIADQIAGGRSVHALSPTMRGAA